MDLDEALDRLYAAPLADFTSTRNALAQELGTEGAQVKMLKKPNLAAWAVNQLARRHADRIEELFAATDRLRRAQRKVLSGGKGTPLREATDERRRIVDRLTNLAADILTEGGHAAAAATLNAVSSSLMSVAADADAADLVRQGRLTKELQAESIVGELGGGLTLIEGDGDAEPEDEAPVGKDRERAIRAAREQVNDARDRVQQARKALKEAEADVIERTRESDEAERAAKAAREAAEFARRASDARKAEAGDAVKALEDAERALDEADPD
jgi:hypothetical protein